MWGGGGDRGVTISRFPYPVLPPPVRFCPFVSRLPPFIVFLPLSCKSRCLTPYSDSNIGSALALSKIKNCVVNRTTPHFPARSLSGIPSTQVYTTRQNLHYSFPASRGLSRRGKNERKERDLCRLPKRCLMKPPTRFLLETYRFQNRFRLMCNARALLD